MKPYHDQLLALVRVVTDTHENLLTLDRLGPSTYPDPTQTSYNDMVQWRVSITFGRGYFQGALVRFKGKWTKPHPSGQTDPYIYAERSQDMPIEQAVQAFLSDTVPAWALPESAQ